MNNSFKRLLLLVFIISITFIFSGCYELEYEDENEYFSLFNNSVDLIYSNEKGDDASSTSVDFDYYFYNEKDSSDFDAEHVDEEYYAYLALEVDCDNEEKFREFCLYFKGEQEENLLVRFYIVDSLPSNDIRCFNLPQTKDGKLVHYSDSNLGEPIAECNCHLRTNTFKDVYVDEYIVNGEKCKSITIEDGQYLLLQFVNNTGFGNEMELNPVKFTMTCLVFNKAGSGN